MNNSKFEKYISSSLAFYPILIQYKSGIPGISIGDLVLLTIVLYNLMYGKRNASGGNYLTQNLVFYIPLVTIITFTAVNVIAKPEANFGEMFTRLTRFAFYVYSGIMLLPRYINFKVFMRTYKKIIWISISFLLVQVFFFNVFNITLFGVLPNLGIGFDLDLVEKYNRHFVNFYRPSSLFIEPGYFARFLIPYLVFLFYPTVKINRQYFQIALILFSLLLSTSGQGIIIAGILVAMKTFEILYRAFLSQKIRIEHLILLIILPVFYILFSKNEILVKSIDRLFGSETASSNSRIISGFQEWFDNSYIHRIFGYGFGNTTYQQLNHSSSTYMNSIAYLLNNVGLVGLVSFFPVFIRKLVSTNLLFDKVLLIVFIVLNTSSSLFLYSGSVFYLTIIFAKKNQIGEHNEN